MKTHLALAMLIIAFHCSTAAAKELSRVDFLTGQGRQAWGANNQGDTKGLFVEEPGKPAFIFSATGSSWIFIQNNIAGPDVLKGIKKVKATAFICSNHPERLKLVFSDGVAWGGACKRIMETAGRANDKPSWQKIESQFELAGDSLLSVAIGFDYQTPGAWACVSKIVVEGVPSGDFAPLPDPLPTVAVEIPAKIHGALRGDDYFTWRYEPNPLFAFDAQTAVPPGDDGAINVVAPINAKEYALVLLCNPSNEIFNCTLRIEGDLASRIDIHRYALEDGNPDRPIKLNPEGLVELGRKQTSGFELVFNTRGMKAGTYSAILLASPQNSGLLERRMPITLTVAPVALPDRMPISVYNFDYSSALYDADLDFLLDARVNVFHMAALSPDQIATVVAKLKQRGYESGSYKLMVEDWHLRDKNKFEESDKAWMDSYTKRLAEAGLKPDDWFFHIYDETLCPEFRAVATAMKAHNPEVRIFSDSIGPVELLKGFSSCVDYWCPIAGTFFDAEHKAAFEYMRSTKKPLWFYSCGAVVSQSPFNYRYHSWLAFREKTQANTYWTGSSTASRTPPGAERFGMTYVNARNEKQPSRRWFHWRAGLEDYLLLHLAATSGNPELAKLAEKLAADVCAQKDPATLGPAITKARRQLLDALSQTPHP